MPCSRCLLTLAALISIGAMADAQPVFNPRGNPFQARRNVNDFDMLLRHMHGTAHHLGGQRQLTREGLRRARATNFVNGPAVEIDPFAPGQRVIGQRVIGQRVIAMRPQMFLQAGAAQQKEAAPPDNPLGKAFRNLFKPGEPRKPAVPEEIPEDLKDDPKRVSRHLDSVDERSPGVPKAGDRLFRIEAMIRRGEAQDALVELEFILKSPIGMTVRSEDGSLKLLHQQANMLLSRLPEDLQRQYRDKHHLLAQRKLQDAQAEGSIPALTEIALRYMNTSAGWQAADLLATSHLDRKEFAPAVRWMSLIDRFHPEQRANPMWTLKYAALMKQIGANEKSEELLNDLKKRLPRGVITIAGETISPDVWLEQQLQQLDEVSRVSETRLTAGGGLKHNSLSPEGTPLLMERWSLPSTDIRVIEEQVEQIFHDTSNDPTPLIPAWQPLHVDGVLISRTFGAVVAVDATTGKELWRTAESLTPEEIMTARPPKSPQEYKQWSDNPISNAYRPYIPSGGDYQQLFSLLFRNGSWGQLSSDGEQVYVIEDEAILSPYRSGNYNQDPSLRDPYWRDWQSSRIAAYDVKSGRPIWKIGGPATSGPLGPSLAGVFFFGPPVRSENDLFVVGERDEEVRLYVLDPETGHERWTVLLGYSKANISLDYERRYWSTPVTVNEGIVICPTTVGWLMGVDRNSRTILWASRYRELPKNSEGEYERRDDDEEVYEEQKEMEYRWTPSAPYVVGERLFVAPSEEPVIQCLDVATGTELWRYEKQEYDDSVCCFAGVSDGRVILHGREEVVALSAEDGELIWSQEVPEYSAPSGKGMLTETRFHLPINGNQIMTLDLKSGKVLRTGWLPDGQPKLGNLLIVKDQLVSLSPFGLTAYDLEESIEARIAERVEENPDDSWAALQKAGIAVVNRDFQSALKSLRKSDPATLSEDDSHRHRDLLRKSLTALLRDDIQKAESTKDRKPALHAEMEELSSLAKTDDQRMTARTLQIRRLLASDEWQPAWELLQEIIAKSDLDQFVVGDDDMILTQFRLWIRARLKQLHEAADDELRQSMQSHVENAIANITPETRSAVLALWDFHPFVKEHIWSNLQSAANDKVEEGIRAQRLLGVMLDGTGDRPTIAAILLSESLLDRGLPRDAAYYWRAATQLHSQLASSGDDELQSRLDQLKARIPESAFEARPARLVSTMRMERSGSGSYYYSSSQNSRTINAASTQVPWFRERRLSTQNSRLYVESTPDLKLEWATPLQSDLRAGSGSEVDYTTVGHFLYFLHRDLLHCIDPVSREVLWAEPIAERIPRYSYRSSDDWTYSATLTTSDDMLDESSIRSTGYDSGMLAFATHDSVVLYGYQKAIVFDALTGKRRWVLNHPMRNHAVHGTSEYLFLVPDDDDPDFSELGSIRVFRMQDGQPVNLDSEQQERLGRGYDTIFDRSVHQAGSRLIEFHVKTRRSLIGLTRPRLQVRAIDPINGEIAWVRSFPTKTRFGQVNRGEIVLIQPDGLFASLDLQTNVLTTHGRLRASDMKTRSKGNPEESESSDSGQPAPGRLDIRIKGGRNAIVRPVAETAEADDAKEEDSDAEGGTEFELRGLIDCFSDRDRFYLNVYQSSDRSYEWDDQGFSSEYIVGNILALPRTEQPEDAPPLWKVQTSNNWMVLERKEDLPFLLFMRRRHVRPNDDIYYYESHVTAIDKADGRILLDEKYIDGSSSYQNIFWNHDKGFVDLKSYRSRLRLHLDYAEKLEALDIIRAPAVAPRPGIAEPKPESEPIQPADPDLPAIRVEKPVQANVTGPVIETPPRP